MMGWMDLRLDGGTKTEDRAGHVALLDASDSYAGHRADVENMATSPGLHSLSTRHLSRAVHELNGSDASVEVLTSKSLAVVVSGSTNGRASSMSV